MDRNPAALGVCIAAWRPEGRRDIAQCRVAPVARPHAPAYKHRLAQPGASAMKFDLLYELQIPTPHDECSEWRCYREALEQTELADRLGELFATEVMPRFR